MQNDRGSRCGWKTAFSTQAHLIAVSVTALHLKSQKLSKIPTSDNIGPSGVTDATSFAFHIYISMICLAGVHIIAGDPAKLCVMLNVQSDLC